MWSQSSTLGGAVAVLWAVLWGGTLVVPWWKWITGKALALGFQMVMHPVVFQSKYWCQWTRFHILSSLSLSLSHPWMTPTTLFSLFIYIVVTPIPSCMIKPIRDTTTPQTRTWSQKWLGINCMKMTFSGGKFWPFTEKEGGKCWPFTEKEGVKWLIYDIFFNR